MNIVFFLSFSEKRKSSRHSIETEQPTSREPRSKSSRLSLEPRSANKRRSDVPSDDLGKFVGNLF